MKVHRCEPLLIGDDGGSDIYHSAYRGLCPSCERLCDGVRLLRDGKVYGRIFCPEHGSSQVLLSGDAAWFLRSLTCIRPASVPLDHATEVDRGCPYDCGLCPDHGQHTCLPIIEITDHCNLDCPICLADNHHRFLMTGEQLQGIIDRLVVTEGYLDTINLSGGEPTLHPDLLGLIDRARRPEVGRISVSSNGTVLAESTELCRSLADRDVYVSLQMDGFDSAALVTLRGPGNHAGRTRRALANLAAAGTRTTLVFTAARGINEHLLGDPLQLLLSSPNILSLMIQPASHTGRARTLAAAKTERLTVVDVVRFLVEQSGGLLELGDFVPLPCSHPSCFALTYLLDAGDGWVPFPRFVDRDRYLGLLTNRGTVRPDQRLEETLRVTIDELWSGADQVPDSDRILLALKGILRRMYPEDRALEISERLRLGEATVKTIFIHAFMDAHTFDQERVRKCCTHYALPDGRLMPGCTYNVLHRQRVSGGA